MSEVSFDGRSAMAEFGFEFEGPREPSAGRIAARLEEILKPMQEALATPEKATLALRNAHAQLRRLVTALDAYDNAQFAAQERKEQTKQYGNR